VCVYMCVSMCVCVYVYVYEVGRREDCWSRLLRSHLRAHTDTPVCVYMYSNLCMRVYMKLVQEQAAEVRCVYIQTQVRVHIHEFI